MSNQILKERNEKKFARIRELYKRGCGSDQCKGGCSMDHICQIVRVSKTTVFFAINGRSKKTDERKLERRKVRKALAK